MISAFSTSRWVAIGREREGERGKCMLFIFRPAQCCIMPMPARRRKGASAKRRLKSRMLGKSVAIIQLRPWIIPVVATDSPSITITCHRHKYLLPSYVTILWASCHALVLAWSPPGSSWLLLAPFGFSWLLLAPPGYSWLLPDPPGTAIRQAFLEI